MNSIKIFFWKYIYIPRCLYVVIMAIILCGWRLLFGSVEFDFTLRLQSWVWLTRVQTTWTYLLRSTLVPSCIFERALIQYTRYWTLSYDSPKFALAFNAIGCQLQMDAGHLMSKVESIAILVASLFVVKFVFQLTLYL